MFLILTWKEKKNKREETAATGSLLGNLILDLENRTNSKLIFSHDKEYTLSAL